MFRFSVQALTLTNEKIEAQDFVSATLRSALRAYVPDIVILVRRPLSRWYYIDVATRVVSRAPAATILTTSAVTVTIAAADNLRLAKQPSTSGHGMRDDDVISIQ